MGWGWKGQWKWLVGFWGEERGWVVVMVGWLVRGGGVRPLWQPHQHYIRQHRNLDLTTTPLHQHPPRCNTPTTISPSYWPYLLAVYPTSPVCPDRDRIARPPSLFLRHPDSSLTTPPSADGCRFPSRPRPAFDDRRQGVRRREPGRVRAVGRRPLGRQGREDPLRRYLVGPWSLRRNPLFGRKVHPQGHPRG